MIRALLVASAAALAAGVAARLTQSLLFALLTTWRRR